MISLNTHHVSFSAEKKRLDCSNLTVSDRKNKKELKNPLQEMRVGDIVELNYSPDKTITEFKPSIGAIVAKGAEHFQGCSPEITFLTIDNSGSSKQFYLNDQELQDFQVYKTGHLATFA